MDRKIRLLLVLGFSVIAGCSEQEDPSAAATDSAAKPAAADKVIVYNWEEYIEPAVLEAFTAETGIDVDYQTFVGNEDLQALLDQGEPFADVVIPSAIPYGRQQVQRRQLQPLPAALKSALPAFDENIARALKRADASGSYLVPYLWGTTGIGYNVDQVRAALGDEARPDSWKLLFDPEYTARLKDCGIAIQAEKAEIIAAANIYYDVSAMDSPLTEYVLSRTLALTLADIRYFSGSTRIIDDLASGRICVALSWSGDVQQAIDRAEEANSGHNIAYVLPKEGALIWVDTMAIPANAPNPEGAAQFIEFILRPENLAQISNFVAYASPLPAAEAFVDPEILGNPTIYPSESDRERLYSVPGTSESNRAARDAAFDALVVSSPKWQPEEAEEATE